MKLHLTPFSSTSLTLPLASKTQEAVAVVEVEYAYKRADGCSGSAVKGIHAILVPHPSTASSPVFPPTGPSRSPDCDSIVSHSGSGHHQKLYEEDLYRVIIASVGYDQRLSLWSPRTSCPTLVPKVIHVSLDITPYQNQVCLDADVTEEGRENALFPDVADIARTRDELLEWLAGLAIHIGDVCALDTCLVSTSSDYKVDVDCSDDKKFPISAYRDAPLDSEIAMIVVGEGFQLLTATV